MKKIAYQGIKASFTEMAIERFLGSSQNAVECQTFAQVFEALATDSVEMAAIPIENSCIGPIVENFDLLRQHDVAIIGEYAMPIEHCLLSKQEVEGIAQIKEVFSHPKALGQCTQFFKERPWIAPKVHEDTAGAAREVALANTPHRAAIASRKTAELYGLKILLEHLEDEKSNTTRFLFLQKAETALSKKGNKVSLLFTLPHTPGALLRVLEKLCVSGINLTQIVSRPLCEKPFEYLFFVDIELQEEIDLNPIIENVQKNTQTLKVLGRYDSSL